MASEEDKRGNSARGFAGLSSRVSAVDSLVTNAKLKKPEPPTVVSSTVRMLSDSLPARDNATRPESQQQLPKQPSSTSFFVRHPLVSTVAIVCVILLFFEIDGQSTRPMPSSTTESPESALPRAFDLPQAPSQSVPSTRSSEEIPPIGTNHILGAAQIHYCLAENIRLDSAKGVLNNTIESDVDRFNKMIADFNSRCSEYRYRRGLLESARSEVERHRSRLESEGHNRFPASRSGYRLPPITNSRVPRDRIVPETQSGLSEIDHYADHSGELPGEKAGAVMAGSQRGQSLPSKGVVNRSSERLDSAGPSLGAARGPQESLADLSALSGEPAQNIVNKPTEDTENLKECLDGRYPLLCNHSILTPSEAIQVEKAERRANLKVCLDGDKPFLCNHSLLTPEQAVQVKPVEEAANFETCLDGRYPVLCNRSLLTPDQAARVRDVEIQTGRRN